MTIKQGDAYNLSIPVVINKEQITSTTGISKVEFCFNGLEAKFFQTSGSADVTFDSVSKVFLYPISQEESFSLDAGAHLMDARVLYSNGNVRGITTRIKINVAPATSTDILS